MCVFEQGKDPDELTKKHKEIFTSDFCDFYRINWHYEDKKDDPYAHICNKGVIGTEGLSLLYETVPKDYEYYIFIDDDMDFYCPDGCDDKIVVERMRDLLLKYRPLAGTFIESQFLKDLKKHDIDTNNLKEAFVAATWDQGVAFWHKSVAEHMFPIIYHGAAGSRHYVHYCLNKLYPDKMHVYTNIRYRNLRHDREWVNPSLSQWKSKETLYHLFNRHTKDKDFHIYWTDVFWEKLLSRYYNEVSVAKDPREFKLEDLAKIYDITNDSYVNRTALEVKK